MKRKWNFGAFEAFIYLPYFMIANAGGSESNRGHMKLSFTVDLCWFVAFWERTISVIKGIETVIYWFITRPF